MTFLRQRTPTRRQADKKFNARWGEAVRFTPTPWAGKEWAIYDGELRKNVEFGTKGFCMSKAGHLNNEHARSIFESPWPVADGAEPRLEGDHAGQDDHANVRRNFRPCALLGGAA